MTASEIVESEATERRLTIEGLHELARFIEDNPGFPVGEVVMNVDLVLRPDDMPNPADGSGSHGDWETHPHDFQCHVTPSLSRWIWEKRNGWRCYFGSGGRVHAKYVCRDADFAGPHDPVASPF
jgi:hypothetical protein